MLMVLLLPSLTIRREISWCEKIKSNQHLDVHLHFKGSSTWPYIWRMTIQSKIRLFWLPGATALAYRRKIVGTKMLQFYKYVYIFKKASAGVCVVFCNASQCTKKIHCGWCSLVSKQAHFTLYGCTPCQAVHYNTV